MEEKNDGIAVKRGWIFDSIIQLGEKRASIYHIDEKKERLKKELSELDDIEKANQIAERLSNYNVERSLLVNGRRHILDGILDWLRIKDQTDYCLVKHEALDYVLACEVHDTRDDGWSEENIELASDALAGAISLAFGFEFKTCLRCLDERLDNKGSSTIF